LTRDEMLEKVKGRNWFLTPEEAKEFGIVTGIMDDDNSISEFQNKYMNMYKGNNDIVKPQNTGGNMDKWKDKYEAAIKDIDAVKGKNEALVVENETLAAENVELKKENANLNEGKIDEKLNRLLEDNEVVLKSEEDGTCKDFENLKKIYTNMGEESAMLVINGYKAKVPTKQDVEPDSFAPTNLNDKLKNALEAKGSALTPAEVANIISK